MFLVLAALGAPPPAHADPGEVLSEQKISSTAGGFSGPLSNDDHFGMAVAALGDLDGNGVRDIAVGARRDDDAGSDRGAVWILFLNADGTVASEQKITTGQGGFTGSVTNNGEFGRGLARLGDLDGDGVTDLAVGNRLDSDGGTQRGSVFVLFLDTDGTVKAHQKISSTQGGFTGGLQNNDFFGTSVASLGDLDGDGVGDLAVGAEVDSDGGSDRGAVWILFLDTDGTVKSHQAISDTQGGFTGSLSNDDRFGTSVAALGDLDGDGVTDLAVGALRDDDGGANRGAVWILFLDTNGTVKSHAKISDTAGNFTGALGDGDFFGSGLASLGDIDGDGTADLAVGALQDDDGGTDRGAVWILFLDTDGSVVSHQKISASAGGFDGALADLDLFGLGVASLGDFDGDGRTDIVVGALGDDDGGIGGGAVWILLLDGVVHSVPGVGPASRLVLAGFIVASVLWRRRRRGGAGVSVACHT